MSTTKSYLARSGGNHYYIIHKDTANSPRIGQAIFDPVRGQFAFVPDDHAVVLTATDKTAITAILNGLSV